MESGEVIRALTFVFSLCFSVFLEFCDLGALSLFKLRLGQCSENCTCGEVVKVVS